MTILRDHIRTVMLGTAAAMFLTTGPSPTYAQETKPAEEKRAAPAAEASTPDKEADRWQTARKILKQHCASCHQDGETTGSYKDRPAGSFGYVLDEKKLIRKGRVIAGNPDTSELFIKIESGEMPKGTPVDCLIQDDADKGPECGPKKAEIQAIHDWIEDLGSKPDLVAKRDFISDDQIIKAISEDINGLADHERSRVRYFTLTHLYNSGDPDDEIEVFRNAVAKLLNSLSRESDPVKVVAVDEHKTVLRANIHELGWTAKQWDSITEVNPYVVIYDNPLFELLQKQTEAVTPFIRADWFAFTASQPPLYYDLLGLPKNKRDLEKLLGINVAKNINEYKVARAGFQKSGVSKNNRLIERHTIATGAYWESYDFAGNQARQSFFKHPLGPSGTLGNLSKKHGFTHDGGEVIFSLPNGFHGYYLTDEKGNRLDKGPTSIVLDSERRDHAVTNGVSCMGCHNQGIKFNDNRPREKQDQVREYVLGTRSLPKEARDAVEALFPKHEEFNKLLVSDKEAYASALERAGVDINKNVSGTEMVNALFQRFERNLDLRQAAAELGLTEKDFVERLAISGKDAYALKLRLENDLVPRDQFVKDYASLVGELTDNKGFDFTELVAKSKNKVQVASAKLPQFSKTFDLALFPNQSHFRVGQTVTFSVKAERDCYLTLINKDDTGAMQVLFPNEHNQNNRIKGNMLFHVPGKHIKGFKLKFTKPGKETIIGICSASRPDPHGILHNFSKQAFTTYTSYGEFLDRSIKVRSRLIAIVKDGNSKKHQTAREKTMPALISNPVDPHIDIQAQKAVVLNVKK